MPFYVSRNGSELMLESLVRPKSPETPTLTIPPNMMPVGRYVETPQPFMKPVDRHLKKNNSDHLPNTKFVGRYVETST